MTAERRAAIARIARLARTDFDLARLRLAAAARAAAMAHDACERHRALRADQPVPADPSEAGALARWQIWHGREAARLARQLAAAEARLEAERRRARHRFARARAADYLAETLQREARLAAERAAERSLPALPGPAGKDALTHRP
ncbi:MAG: hypothetical protein D6754_06940 [Alphaproteobacteria bacterium]|nr:MAG: hypothetical protein D6754_06940 [Alphaproteobacteria bacterium]